MMTPYKKESGNKRYLKLFNNKAKYLMVTMALSYGILIVAAFNKWVTILVRTPASTFSEPLAKIRKCVLG